MTATGRSRVSPEVAVSCPWLGELAHPKSAPLFDLELTLTANCSRWPRAAWQRSGIASWFFRARGNKAANIQRMDTKRQAATLHIDGRQSGCDSLTAFEAWPL